MPDKKTVLGFAIGVGCTLAAPLAVSLCASAARPVAKSILKRALLAANTALEKLAVAAESVTDLIAEVRAEVDEELLRKGPPGTRDRSRTGANGPTSEAEADGVAAPSRQGAG